MYMILAPLSAARGHRRAIEIAGQHGGDLGIGLQFDQRDVEAFLLKEALVERDVGRNVETVAADHFADRDLGLGIGARGGRKGSGGGKQQEPEHAHHSLLFFTADRRERAKREGRGLR
jgi:hypothetical protein